jgi:error-prone DNA polymerase
MFAEPIAATNFSFLTGASHPGEMVEQAIALGMAGIGIADRNSVAGVVRAHSAWKTARKEGRVEDFKLIVGARLVFADGTPDIVAYPTTRRGWGTTDAVAFHRQSAREKKASAYYALRICSSGRRRCA